MVVKVCGVRTVEDGLGCVAAGVDAIGINFWPGSRRYLAPEAARPLARAIAGRVRRVGVFVDASYPEVAGLLDEGVIDLAQLHGDEPVELCARLGGRAYKAFRLRDEATLQTMAAYPGELVLVDADAPGYGGSGRLADRALARRAAVLRQTILAGGLDPDNVAEAVRQVRPFGVDVAGGVERAPGVKDLDRVQAFVRAARGA